MIKLKLFIISLMSVTMLFACSSDKQENIQIVSRGLLKSFKLSQLNKVYHANIDELNNLVSIGGIEYGSNVTNVSFTIEEGASISPAPADFIRDWPEEVLFTIVKGNKTEHYKVILTQYLGKDPSESETDSILFFTDFTEANGIPDPEVWSLCAKGSSTWNAHMSGSYDQAYVENGVLVLKAEKIAGEYKTGGIESVSKKSFRNARIDIRARFDKSGQGGFPALWMMPQNQIYKGWPDCGEIDIMELLNHEKIIHQTIHNKYKNILNFNSPVGTRTSEYIPNEYNIYSVEMNDQAITFFVNNQQTFSYPNLHLEDEEEKRQWPFSTDFYLILNYALGGPGTWPGPIIDADLPLMMSIDWIKVRSLERNVSVENN